MLPEKRLVKAPVKRVAKKRAVAKVTSVVTTAVAVPKKRQRAVKKLVAREKKVAIIKAAPAKRIVRTRSVRKIAVNPATETVAMLEGTISKRLLAKRQAYEDWYKEQSLRHFGNLATVSGYLFIVIGFFLSLYILGPNWLTFKYQTAALQCLESEVCEATTSTSQVPTVTYVVTPEVVPGKDLVVTVQITGLTEPKLIVVSNTVPPLTVSPTSADSKVYTFIVPTTTFLSGMYRLRIEGETASFVRTSFAGPIIEVGAVPVRELPAAEETVSSSTTPQVAQIDWELEPHQLSIQDGVNGMSLVQFTSMYKFEQVAIYTRPDHSVQEFFLGQAEKQEGVWQYSFSTAALPFGSYTILAKGVDQGEVKGEAMISLKNKLVDGVASSTGVTNRIENLDEKEDSLALLKALSIENHAGTTSELNQTDLESSPFAATQPTTSLPEAVTRAIHVFALAKQTNNSLLIRVSESAIAKAIMDEVQQQTTIYQFEPVAAASYEHELRTKVKKELAVRVLNSQNSTEFYPVDTDQDGIPDEEEVADKTNAIKPDTDNDGILDGIEKVFGYDPISAVPEAVVRLESSVEVPIIETLLGIEAVSPYAFYTENESRPHIYQEITGYAIPNSFVLLKVNDTEVISPVLVAADGKFTHLLEYELANGPQAITLQYIANSGVPVAASRVFNFIKDDTTINYIKVAASAPVVSATMTTQINSNLPAAVGIVAFGLLLLYIGRSLRLMQLTDQKQSGRLA